MTGRLYDAAVVGAGPAGSSTATYLARAGWQVALVDRAAFPRDKPCAEYLSPAAEPLLRALGVMDTLAAHPPSRLLGFRIYAPGGSVIQGDFAATKGSDGATLFASGLAVPRSRLDLALMEAAAGAGAEVRERWSLASLALEEDCYRLHPAGPASEPIRARLLVAADGVHSVVARRLGLARPAALRKVALVAHMRGIGGLGDYGEMHVANRRYVGLAPLEPCGRGDLCNVALVVDEARDGRKIAGRAEAFLLESLATFPGLRGRLADATIVRKTLATSGLCTRVRRLSGARLLLVGDAAGYYDPFTGEGIFRALRSAQLAARVGGAALASGDVGAMALARYDRAYKAEFRGKRAVEWLIQSGVRVPLVMDRFASVLARHKTLADTVVAVTGDFLPPSAVLRPGFLLRLALG